MLTDVKNYLAKELASLSKEKEETVAGSFELPKEEFGDLASKIAFILAGKEKRSPVQIAQELKIKLEKKKLKWIEKIAVQGPYLNFYFSDEFYSAALKKISKEKDKYGKGKKAKKKIMVEFFHANPFKGTHIGHIRTGSLGESLSRILEFLGNRVIRANYQGDIGPHVAKCLWGFINIYNQKAPEENRGIWLGQVYAEASKKIKDNEKLEEEVKEINTKLYAGDKQLIELWKKACKWCLDDFEEFYKEFGIKFDEIYLESQVEKLGKKIVKDALEKGIVKEDQGAIIIDLKDENLGVFVLLTKEGYPLYSTKDLGLIKLKLDKYDLDKSIHVVGKEQEFYFKQLFKTFEKFGFEKAAKISRHLVYELVMLPEGKMSSREGTMVLYEELKEKLLAISREEIKKRHEDWNEKQIEKTALQIALGALKFSMLRRESNKVILFDWNEALKLEGDTGPYLQYAYVRTQGILSKAKECKTKTKISKKYSFNTEEKQLMKKLMEFPEIVEKSARDLAPNYLAIYLLDAAAAFNKFYTVSPVLNAEKVEETASRITIVNASRIVLSNGLTLLGISCPEKM